MENTDPVKANASTPGVLNCDSFTNIWISWLDGIVRVGRGSLFDNTFLFYHDSKMFPMRALSLQTPTSQDKPSEWQFARKAGRYKSHY